MDKETIALLLLVRSKAFVTGHVELKNGMHSEGGIAPERIYHYGKQLADASEAIANEYEKNRKFIDTEKKDDNTVDTRKSAIDTVLGVGAEADKLALFVSKYLPGDTVSTSIYLVDGQFAIDSYSEKFIPGRKILIVMEVLLEKEIETFKKAREFIHSLSGNILGVGVILKRPGLSSVGLGVPILASLTEIKQMVDSEKWKVWPKDNCKLCKQHVPIVEYF